MLGCCPALAAPPGWPVCSYAPDAKEGRDSGWRFVLGGPCKYTGTPAKEMKQRGIGSGDIGPKKDDCAGKPCRGCANILRGCMEASLAYVVLVAY